MPDYSSNFTLSALTRVSTLAGGEAGDLNTALKYEILNYLAQPAKSTVTFDGTKYICLDGPTKLVTHVGTDVDAAIQAGMSNLTSSRVAKEKITLVGLFATTVSIVCEDFTILDLTNARIIPEIGDNYSTLDADQAIVRNEKRLTGSTSDRNKYIDIIGGYIDGTGTYDTGKAISNIDIRFCENLTITNVHSVLAREHNIQVDGCINVTIGWNQCVQAGDDSITLHDTSGNCLIIGNECSDGRIEADPASPSGGAENGIEIENETGLPDDAPLNLIVAFNRCWNNDRNIIYKTDGTSSALSHASFIGNTCWGSLSENFKVSSASKDKIIGLTLTDNIFYGAGTRNIWLADCIGASIKGGSIYGAVDDGIYITLSTDTHVGGGINIYLNGDHGINATTTALRTVYESATIRNNNVAETFSYGIADHGTDWYIGPGVTIIDDRGTPLQLGLKVTSTATNVTIDNPLFMGWKDASGAKDGPIYLSNSSVPTGFKILGLRTPGNTDLVIEAEGEATTLSTTDTIPHGLDLAQDTVLDISNSSIFGISVIAESGTVGNIITTCTATTLVVTFTGGGTIDVKWWIKASKWSA